MRIFNKLSKTFVFGFLIFQGYSLKLQNFIKTFAFSGSCSHFMHPMRVPPGNPISLISHSEWHKHKDCECLWGRRCSNTTQVWLHSKHTDSARNSHPRGAFMQLFWGMATIWWVDFLWNAIIFVLKHRAIYHDLSSTHTIVFKRTDKKARKKLRVRRLFVG